MIREDEHALQVFDTPIPGEMDFIDLMVIWLYNLYIHLAVSHLPSLSLLSSERRGTI